MGGGKEEKGREVGQIQLPPNNSTLPITESQFLAWKRHKDADSSARSAEAAQKREQDIAAGTVPMNGRELFLHEPWVFDNSRY